MTSCLAFMTSCLAFMTSCFASASCCMCFASLSCFDDVVLLRSLFFRRRTSCFASTTYDVRRRALCFASTTRSAFPSRSACFARRVLLRCTQRTQPSVSQIACVVCPCLPFLSLSLSLGGGGPCFSFPFLSRRKNTGPGLRLLRAFSTCLLCVFAGAASPATENFCALRAALCSPRYK